MSNEETATLKHHMSVSLFPNMAQPDPGTLRRSWRSDTLTITAAPILVEGSARTPRLIWKRATPNRGPAEGRVQSRPDE